MNIRQISPNIFRFDLYNLNFFKEVDIGIEAHWTFWYHNLSKKYAMAKLGDYHNLVSIRPVKDNPCFPNETQRPFTDELITEKIKHACFYDQSAPLNNGKYLLDELEEKCVKRNGFGTEWFKHDCDEFYDYVMKKHLIFPVDYPKKDYKLDRKEWDEVKRRDKLAIKLLNS